MALSLDYYAYSGIVAELTLYLALGLFVTCEGLASQGFYLAAQYGWGTTVYSPALAWFSMVIISAISLAIGCTMAVWQLSVSGSVTGGVFGKGVWGPGIARYAANAGKNLARATKNTVDAVTGMRGGDQV